MGCLFQGWDNKDLTFIFRLYRCVNSGESLRALFNLRVIHIDKKQKIKFHS